MPRLASVTGGFAGFAAIGVSLAPPATGGEESVVGTLYIWGYNSDGQIGDSTITNKSTATQIGSLSWTQIAVGEKHTMAIRDDGLLFGWGDNSKGQIGDSTFDDKSSPVQIGSDSWSRISTRKNTTIGIKGDGTMWGWGTNANGQMGNNAVIDTSGITSWTKITGDNYTALAIRYDGTLWAWGRNTLGQLGLNDTVDRVDPVQIGTGTWTDVSFGSQSQHTVAVRSDGTLWAWGGGSSGALGQGNTVNKSSPTQIGALTTWAKAIAGGNTSAAIRTDGSAYVWGWGIPGNGVNSSYTSPILTSGGGSWSKLEIAGNYGSTNFIGINNGSLLGWGSSNSYGLFGGTKTAVLTPTSAAAGTWIDCTINGQYWNAVRNDGTLWWRGRNLYGNGGAGTAQLFRSSPVQTGSDTNWSQVRTHSEFAVGGVKTNNTLWFWGYNTPTSPAGQLGAPTQYGTDTTWTLNGVHRATEDYGFYIYWLRDTSSRAVRLNNAGNAFYSYGGTGDGTPVGNVAFAPTEYTTTLGSTSNWKTPQQIGTSSWTAVTAGADHTVAIDTAGNLWGWGNNSQGQVGDLTTVAKSSPVQITSGTSWKSVDAGSQFTLAVDSANALYAWGVNSKNQLGDGTSASKSSPVAIGSGSWKSVSAGYDHSLGINSGNSLYGWGSFTGAEITQGTWASVAVGMGYSSATYATDRTYIAVNTAGAAFAWGNNQGIFDTSSGLPFNNFSTVFLPTAIATGQTWQKVIAVNRWNALGIDTSGRLWSWGLNYYGELGQNDVISKSSPTQVGTATDWADIVGDNDYVLALKTNGTLWAWGRNNYGQLGDGTTVGKSSPVQIGSSSWSKISASYRQSAGITGNKLYFWGGYSNASGSIGQSSPTQYGTDDWISINVAGALIAGVKSSGQAWTWPSTEYSWPSQVTTVQFGTATNWTQGWANSGGAYFFKNSSGQLYSASGAFGAEFGVLGDGSGSSFTPLSAPLQIGSSTAWVMVANGAQNTMVGIDGTSLVRWGRYYYPGPEVRGDGSTDAGQDNSPYNISLNRGSIATPTQIGSSTWKTAEAGNGINFLTDSSDNVYAWGINNNNALPGLDPTVGSPTALTGVTAKAVRAGDGTHAATIR